MRTCKAKDIEAALLLKGFTKSDSKDRRFFYLDPRTNRKTMISTMISHGEKEIGITLITAMARQMKISKKQFQSFVECNFKKEEYQKHLEDSNIV